MIILASATILATVLAKTLVSDLSVGASSAVEERIRDMTLPKTLRLLTTDQFICNLGKVFALMEVGISIHCPPTAVPSPIPFLTDVQENTATIIEFGGAVSGFPKRRETSHESKGEKSNVDHFVGR